LAVSPGGEKLAASESGSRISLWNMHTGRKQFSSKAQGGSPTSIAFDASGDQLSVLSAGGILNHFDAAIGFLQANSVVHCAGCKLNYTRDLPPDALFSAPA
jgi:WD40 repeat protein